MRGTGRDDKDGRRKAGAVEEGDARGRAHTAGVADADAAEEVVDNLRERNSVWRDCRRTGRAAGTYFSANALQRRRPLCENAEGGITMTG